jgi:excinuclease ABC subunit C
MKNDRPVNDLTDLAGNRYPHFKLTAERYPRLLATRRVENDDPDEYFGAFLPKTGVRILIDLLNKTFRLRSCELDIDGSFPMPCTQYFRRRCAAPCVASLCSSEEYAELVGLVRFILANEQVLFRRAIGAIIERYSDELEFEKAARYRDMAFAIDKFWANARLQVWLDATVDTFAVEDTPEGTSIFLVTHRGRRVLGRKVFAVDREDYEASDLALARLIDSFYLFHLPREIRVSRDFQGRKTLEQQLTDRHGRLAKIIVVNPRSKGINAYRGLLLSHDEHELDKAKPLASAEIISAKLRRIFDLEKRPVRIEAFDVAHISGTGFVWASAVWLRGKFVSNEYQFQISDLKSEITVLAEGVRNALLTRPPHLYPDLIVLDGGKGQLNAVISTLADLPGRPPIIAAVKPANKHSSIASFLTESGRSISFNVDSPAHTTLQILRDEAHNLANRIHRDYREMKPFYEAAGNAEPLIVPIRLHEQNGGAEDLIPINSR